jgi:hypothetical protein
MLELVAKIIHGGYSIMLQRTFGLKAENRKLKKTAHEELSLYSKPITMQISKF